MLTVIRMTPGTIYVRTLLLNVRLCKQLHFDQYSYVVTSSSWWVIPCEINQF